MATTQFLPESHAPPLEGRPLRQREPWDYQRLKEALRGERLPAIVVDLDRFDANVAAAAEGAAARGKTLRPASKSLRVPDLLRRVAEVGGPAVRGLMCYSVAEAAWLAQQGFDDLLVAYPSVQEADLALAAQVTRNGQRIALTMDCLSHVELLAESWRRLGATSPLRVCIDVDVSWRPLGFHIGAQRSPLRSLAALEELVDAVVEESSLKLVGILAYEAHLAGVPDASPFTPLKNIGVRLMRSLARRDLARKRQGISECLKRRGITLDFFNGGGTGWFAEAMEEPWLTEVTAGSGFLQPHLFDYYRSSRREPAILFALAVTRRPQADVVTCQGGGFIASGPCGADRAPVPFLPEDWPERLTVEPGEGFGEVQTPLSVPPDLRGTLQIGDPVFFRPAKAGEIAERFDEYLLLKDDRIVARAKTYRGCGQCFH